MDRTSTEMTIADYYGAYKRGDIQINRDYQRSDKVWPETAKSFLIESIILGFPIPKLSLHQITDVKTRTTRKEVVDGQQRSRTIWSYLENEFRIAPTSEATEAAGKRYDELEESAQEQILSYALNFDLFINTSQEEVREVFRRINSFTVPLNAEEQRYAQYQGKFKWFIYRVAHDYDLLFVESGLFGPKQLVRLQDTKWLAEISHAIMNGITTTNKRSLDRLYKELDKEFPSEVELIRRFSVSFDLLLEWEPLHKTSLFKPYVAYSLVLALMHVTEPATELQTDFPWATPITPQLSDIGPSLTALSDAVEEGDTEGPFGDFVRSSITGTNVKKARTDRFVWFCRALTGGL